MLPGSRGIRAGPGTDVRQCLLQWDVSKRPARYHVPTRIFCELLGIDGPGAERGVVEHHGQHEQLLAGGAHEPLKGCRAVSDGLWAVVGARAGDKRTPVVRIVIFIIIYIINIQSYTARAVLLDRTNRRVRPCWGEGQAKLRCISARAEGRGSSLQPVAQRAVVPWEQARSDRCLCCWPGAHRDRTAASIPPRLRFLSGAV